MTAFRAAIARTACAAAALSVLAACERRADVEPADGVQPVDTMAAAETRRLGPFTVGDAPWEVLLGVLRHADDETVQHLRVVDADGTLQYEQEFGTPDTLDWGFAETVAIHAWTVTGASGSGLMLVREHLPSAPMTGASYQVFGRRGDRLLPLFPPLAWHGEFVEPLPEPGQTSVRLPDGDVITVQLWRYHFGAHLPLRLDLACVPDSDACLVPAATPLPDAPGFSRMEVWTDLRRPAGQQYITLLPAPGADAGATVPVHADSQIQVIEAAARVALRLEEHLDVVVREEHLRIRIDGRGGWIRGPEDFEAIGLPAAG